jgi:hypothetical protein
MAQRGRKARIHLVEPAALRVQLGGHLGSPPSEPPPHLGDPERTIWAHAHEFELSNGLAEDVLIVALEAHQRARQAREIIDAEGLTVFDQRGQPKPHPLLATERDSRGAFLNGIRALGLKL